jgi:transposase
MARGHLLTQDGRQWVRSEAWPLLGPERRLVIRMQWTLIARLTPMIRSLDKRVERMGWGIPAVSLLRTVPGIGPYRALLIATETLPIERFSKPAHLVSYAGLAPRTSQSGLRPIRHGSIPAGANRWLRGAFICAVVTHIAHAPDSWLSHAYEQTRQRLGWQVARVATARRLARAVHAMLRTGEAWRDESTYREKSELQETHVALTTSRFD